MEAVLDSPCYDADDTGVPILAGYDEGMTVRILLQLTFRLRRRDFKNVGFYGLTLII